MRQWVTTLPKRLRYFVHRDPELTGHVLKVGLRALVTAYTGQPLPSALAQLGFALLAAFRSISCRLPGAAGS